MSKIKDKVAHIKYKFFTVRSKPKCIDFILTERRRLTRKYERKYRKNKTNHNKDIYLGLQKEYRNRLTLSVPRGTDGSFQPAPNMTIVLFIVTTLPCQVGL